MRESQTSTKEGFVDVTNLCIAMTTKTIKAQFGEEEELRDTHPV